MRTISHYQILEKLGAGGMGEVYLAQDLTLGRKVAIKLLPSQFTSHPERLKRFEREARTVSALNHPNILTIYEIAETDGELYLATEYVDGETLRQRMRPGPLNPDEIVEIAIGIASALTEAHSAGVVHRDIKPDNVMIRRDGFVKVLDFGLAKWTEPGSDQSSTLVRQTDPGTVLGTATYMSPEQARGLDVDARSDLFSLGAVLYEMLTGRAPFSGETNTDILSAIISREAVPVSRFRPDAPRELQWITEKALQKDRESRYQSAKEMLADLKRLGKEIGSDERVNPSTSTAPPSEATSTPATDTNVSSAEYIITGIQRHKWATLLAILVIAALLAALAFFPKREALIDSVAVLPFAWDRVDTETEYLADGLTESLINDLSEIDDLRVVPRSLVFAYKGSDKTLDEIAAELGARAVVTGRVNRTGNELDVQADLVDVEERSQLWGDRFTGNASNLVALQSHITRELSSRIRPDMKAAERERVEHAMTDDPEAYDLYLKARYLWNRRRPEDITRSIELFQRALDRDPTFAQAWSGLADAYLVLPNYLPVTTSESHPKAKAAAQRALEIDPSMAQPHAVLAGVAFEYEREIERAEREFRKSIDLDPDRAATRYWFAELLSARGRHEEALEQAKIAAQIDPLSIIAAQTVAVVHLELGNLTEARKALAVAEELDPSFPGLHRIRGEILLEEGNEAAAANEFEQFSQEVDTPAFQIWSLFLRGERARAEELLRQLEKSEDRLDSFDMAAAYATLGHYEEAMKWLEKADEERSPFVVHLRDAPQFEPLYDDPRFEDLVRRLGVAHPGRQ